MTSIVSVEIYPFWFTLFVLPLECLLCGIHPMDDSLAIRTNVMDEFLPDDFLMFVFVQYSFLELVSLFILTVYY